MSTPSPEEVDVAVERLERLAASIDPSLIEAIGDAEFADRAAEQPWLLAGVSDGMGLRVTLAAIEAGVLCTGVGVYWEPPALLKIDEDGEPVSPVHWARYQNALALEKLAADRGVDLEVMSADVMMNPRRGLKGDIKGEVPEFSEEVREAVERKREAARRRDVVFIDSVAFGKWMCPREGEEPVQVPSVDFEGRVVRTRTKKYHPRGYNETLDTMGRNHGRLLETFREFGWLGEEATTAFFTWAGGSQNVEVLEGIYGRGALGDAKIVAERDVLEFRLEHGREHGDHAIVRLPAFLSAALMAIPGGGLFGLVSRKTLEEKGAYRDMSELAGEMVRRLFGREWVRENPIAQIELDSNEILHLPEISDRVAEAHRRVEEFRAGQSEEEQRDPIPLQESRRLLEGLVPEDYVEILSRFRPDDDSELNSGSFDLDAGLLREHGRAPAATTLAAALRPAEGALQEWAGNRTIAGVEDEIRLEDGWPGVSDTLRGEWGLTADEEEGVAVLRRRVRDQRGRVVARGTTRFYRDATTLSPALEVSDQLGEPAGWRMEVDERPLGERFWAEKGQSRRSRPLWDGAAVSAFSESAMREAWTLDGPQRVRSAWSTDGLPGRGDRIMTYVDEETGLVRGVAVDEEATAVVSIEVGG